MIGQLNSFKKQQKVSKKICIVHYSGPPIVGGVEEVISNHVDLFVNAGYSINLIIGRGGNFNNSFKVKTYLIPEIDTLFPINIKINQDLIENKISNKVLFNYQNKIEDKLFPILKKSDILIIHNIMNFHFNIALTLALQKFINNYKIPTIAWCHDISRYINPDSNTPLKFGFPWDCLRIYNPKITYVTVSEKRKKSLLKIFKKKNVLIKTIPNGVKIQSLLGLSSFGYDFFKFLSIQNIDLIILMPVRITKAKNIELALEIVKELKTNGLRVKLIISGPPDPHSSDSIAYFSFLQKMRNQLNLDDEVIFMYEKKIISSQLKIQSPAQISELYRISDIILITSTREGFGIPIIEAGLLGKIIFSTRIPSVTEIAKNLVYTVDLKDSPQKIAKKIITVISKNNVLRLKQKIRKEYLWEQIFKNKIQPLINDLLKK